MPMTKAGVRAMDVVTEFLTSNSAPQEIQEAGLNPTMWGVSGASKVGKCFKFFSIILSLISERLDSLVGCCC